MSDPVRSVEVTGLPATSTERVAVEDAVVRWLESSSMTKVLARFNGEVGRRGSVVSRIAQLEKFTRAQFDLRVAGQERWETDQPDYPHDVGVLADAALRELTTSPGVITPTQDASTVPIVVLGAHLARMVQRVELARHLAVPGRSSIIGLACTRPLVPQETQLAALLGLRNSTSEVDSLRDLLDQILPESAQKKMLNAPARPGHRRATTSDALQFLSVMYGGMRNVTVVTTAHFAPYQHAQAIRILDGPVRTFGVSQGSSGPFLVRDDPTAADLLQEIHSTVQALRNLLTS